MELILCKQLLCSLWKFVYIRFETPAFSLSWFQWKEWSTLMTNSVISRYLDLFIIWYKHRCWFQEHVLNRFLRNNVQYDFALVGKAIDILSSQATAFWPLVFTRLKREVLVFRVTRSALGEILFLKNVVCVHSVLHFYNENDFG